MLSKDALNQISDVVNSTWGKSSGNGSTSLTCTMEHDKVLVKYQTVVHFASEKSLREQVDKIILESNELISKKLSDLKSKYKEAAEVTLKFEEISNNDSVEIIYATNNNPRKIAIYRRNCRLQVQ